ncbi:MAG: elongation factor P [Candidatus Izimaplasma sp.]|nr:elongation factor P [Candidatus Izimaplasma bacterium]
MVAAGEFRNGITFEMENNIYVIIEFQHVKPGKGPAFVRSKLRNLRTQGILDKTWRAGEKVAPAHIDKDKMSYLYAMGDIYVFMNNDTYEQIEIPFSSIERQLNFIIEGMEVNVISFEGEILGVDIPEKVTLVVTHADPAVKGNTAQTATKDAIVETGFKLQVPLFVNQGEKIVVNTNTGKYDTRA